MSSDIPPQPDDCQVGQIVDEILSKISRGEDPDIDEYIEEHPDAAVVLRHALPALRAIGDSVGGAREPDKWQNDPTNSAKSIGDFRLVRELGRGGMGVVYEAEQLSMGRRVALKVLPFAAMVDDKMLQRFRNEVRAAATLGHPNIVPVYSVGEERGVHFYAMELIQGRTLADVIAQLRELRNGEVSLDGASISRALSTTPRLPLSQSANVATVERETGAQAERFSPARNAEGSTVPELRGADSTHQRSPAREYYRSVAALGQQVADALQHAHENGILHRDIKPGNLLLDSTGKAYIADFGLARIEADAGVTMTGDVIGTLRYMAPEQALAKRVVVDHRADVYSLGMTLYELLTLRPAFDQPDRQALLKQIAFGEPEKPTRVDRAIPAELETIILKAIAKSPEERYSSARELADDFSHFLNDMPIRARRPSLMQRAGKWTRRNKTLVRTASATMAIAVAISGALLWSAFQRETVQRHLAEKNAADAEQQRTLALDATQLAKQQEHLAKQQRDAAEYNAYVANIRLAGREWAAGRTPFEQLSAVVPEVGRPDFRGWEYHHLTSQVHPQVFEFPLQMPGDTASVLAWKPDGSCLATVDVSGLVNLWDMATGSFQSSLEGCAGKVLSIAWSPDGKYLAAGSNAKVVVIWNVGSGTIERTLRQQTSTVRALAWHPDGVQLAAGSDDGFVRIWDAGTGAQICTLSSNRIVRSLDWHPKGKHLLAAIGPHIDRAAILWNVSTAEVDFATELENGAGRAYFCREGQQFVTGGGYSGGKIIFRDSQTKRETLSLAGDGCLQTAISPNGNRLVGAFLNQSYLRFYDLDRAPEAMETQTMETLPGHDMAPQQLLWSPNGTLLASSDVNGTVKVWNVEARQIRQIAQSKNVSWQSLAFSPDSRRLLFAGQNRIVMWDIVSQSELFHREYAASQQHALEWSPDGRRFAAAGMSRLTICDAATGNPVASPMTMLRTDGRRVEINSLDWHPGGQLLAVGFVTDSVRGSIRILDAETWEERGTIEFTSAAHDFTVFDHIVAWSPDGSRLAVAGDRTRIYDARLKELASLDHNSLHVGWSADGRYLSMRQNENEVAVLKTNDWTKVHSLKGVNPVRAIKWHPSENRLATGDRGGIVRVWDMSVGREVALIDLGGMTCEVAWAPDGLTLAATVFQREGRFIRVMYGRSGDEHHKQKVGMRKRAAKFTQQGNYVAAQAILEYLSDAFPNNEDVRNDLHRSRWLHAMRLAIDDQMPMATKVFMTLEAESANVPDYRLRLPASLAEAGKYTEAVALAEEMVETFPQRRQYRDALASIYEIHVIELCRAGNLDKAISSLGKLANRFSERPDFRLALAVATVGSEYLPETMEMIEQLAPAFEDRFDYRPELAQRLTKAGEYDHALMVYETLLAEEPDSHGTREAYSLARIEQFIAKQRLDEALELFASQTPSPSKLATGDSLGQALGNRGLRYAQEQRFEEAIGDLTEAFELLTLTEDQGVTGYWLALLQLAAGNHEEYRATCRLLLDKCGSSDDALTAFWTAWTCVLSPKATNDLEAVHLAAQKSHASDPQSVSYLNGLGAVLFRKGEFKQAITRLHEASELAEAAKMSSPAYTWFFLALAHDKLGNIEEASQWLEKATTLANEELSDESVDWNRRLTLEILQNEANDKISTESESKGSETSDS